MHSQFLACSVSRRTIFPAGFVGIEAQYPLDKPPPIPYSPNRGAQPGLIGNPVIIGSGPAAVIGDDHRKLPLRDQSRVGRRDQ